MSSRRVLVFLPLVLLGCRCGTGQPQAKSAPAVKSGCREGAQEKVEGVERTVMVDGLERTYILDVPAGEASTRLPVVMSFHGIGASPGPLREFTALGLLSRIGVNESAAWLVGHLGFWAAEFVPAVIGGIILALRPAQYRPDIQELDAPVSHGEA